MTKKTSPVMIAALIVARVQGSVWAGARWEIGVGRVKTGTMSALIDRDLIMRNPSGKWVLTSKGYFELAAEGIITFEQAEQEQRDFDEMIEEAHAEALDMNRDSDPLAEADFDEEAVYAQAGPLMLGHECTSCGHLAAHHQELFGPRGGTHRGACQITKCSCTALTRQLVPVPHQMNEGMDPASTDALGDAPTLAESTTPTIYTCGRSWKTPQGRFTCDVRITWEQQRKPVPAPNVGPRHQGPCFDNIRKVWDATEAARYPSFADYAIPATARRVADGTTNVPLDDVMRRQFAGLMKEAFDEGSKLHELKCALSYLIGRWESSIFADQQACARELNAVLKECK